MVFVPVTQLRFKSLTTPMTFVVFLNETLRFPSSSNGKFVTVTFFVGSPVLPNLVPTATLSNMSISPLSSQSIQGS